MAVQINLSCLILLQYFIILIHNSSGLINLSKNTAIFVFGDSAVDTGNNNYIRTMARSNYAPYGMNFPGHVPTGRYSDGKLIPDILVSAKRIKDAVPPFLLPNISDTELLSGVSFASAAAGFDDRTTSLTNAIPMSKQLQMFGDYLDRLKRVVPQNEARRIVKKAIVMIHGGTVDFLFNFYLGHSNRQLDFTLSGYQDFLLNNLQIFLEELYGLGCRKVIVSGLPPIGCLPIVMTVYSPLRRTCAENLNTDSQLYNEKLVKLLPQVQAKFPKMQFLYLDTYNQLMDMMKNPRTYGFSETTRGCCGTGYVEVTQLCNPLTPVCRNQSEYLFWDSVHPTEAAYRYLSDELLKNLTRKN